MNADVVIIGAGPAGMLFTALEMVKRAASRKLSWWKRARR